MMELRFVRICLMWMKQSEWWVEESCGLRREEMEEKLCR